MVFITAERPVLLSLVVRAFAYCGVSLWNAKMATLGSSDEDFYYITDLDNNPLNEHTLECLEKSVTKYLELDGNREGTGR